MQIHLQPSSAATRAEAHTLSHHPVVKRILREGEDKLWTAKEIAHVLQVDIRTAEMLLKDGDISATCSGYSMRQKKKVRRRCTTAALLLHVLTTTTTPAEADTMEALANLTRHLSDRVLQALSDHCVKLIQRRQGRAVITLTPPAAAPNQMDLFGA